MRLLAFLFALLPTTPAAAQVGFAAISAPDPADQPLAVNVWYPSPATGTPQLVGPYSHVVARDAPIRPGRLPLVVLSHGAGGSGSNQADTAVALARAGFIVAAPTHTGDNSRDSRLRASPRLFPERSRHIARVIDHMTTGWMHAASVDRTRIGMLGYSAGATTALVTLGAKPDPGRLAEALGRAGAPASDAAQPASLQWTGDTRVRAAVLVAPALGDAFGEASLRRIQAPVQVWAGDRDELTPAERSAEVLRRRLPPGTGWRLVHGAGHYSFLQVCPPALTRSALPICADPEGFDRASFRPGFNESVVEFFRGALR